MKKMINGYDVVHIDKETGELICETTGCVSIIDNSLSEKEKKERTIYRRTYLKF